MAKKQSKNELTPDEVMQKYGLKPFNKTIEGISRINSGSFILNNLISQNILKGYIAGGIVEIFGQESSGKTTLALTAAAEMQKINKTVMFCDAESSLNPDHAKDCGVDMSQLIYYNPESGEEAFDAINDVIKHKIADLVIVDSVAALVPKAELEGNEGMGAHARMMSSALRKLVHVAAHNKVTVIFINQVRNKIGVMFGDPTTTCVHPGTTVRVINTETMEDEIITMNNLFRKLGYNYSQNMKIGEFYDVSDSNLAVLGYDHEKQRSYFNKIFQIVYKGEQPEYVLKDSSGNVVLSCSDKHQVYDVKRNDYIAVSEIGDESILTLTDKSFFIRKMTVHKTGNTIPVIDFQVERENYYANNILSHNTGGMALRFYAGIRIKMKSPIKMTPSYGELKQQTAASAMPIGIWMRPHIIKNKMGVPFKTSEIPYVFGAGVCWPLEIYRLAKGYELLNRKGGKLTINDIPIGTDMEDFVEQMYKMKDEDIIKILQYMNSQIKELNKKDIKFNEQIFKIESASEEDIKEDFVEE